MTHAGAAIVDTALVVIGGALGAAIAKKHPATGAIIGAAAGNAIVWGLALGYAGELPGQEKKPVGTGAAPFLVRFP